MGWREIFWLLSRGTVIAFIGAGAFWLATYVLGRF
jgi:hypothetical protein